MTARLLFAYILFLAIYDHIRGQKLRVVYTEKIKLTTDEVMPVDRRAEWA